ncbi:MAG: hypothetical protein Kow00128_22430 [Deltaproteobacteria bacterium]
MCRMLAVAAARPVLLSPFLEHLRRFCLHGHLVERWERRPGGNHPDGWGVAYRQENKTVRIRGGLPAAKDPRLRRITASSDRFLGHVRYASETGPVSEENAHPFFVEGVALAHNGTIRGTIGEESARRKVSDTLVFLERLTAIWRDRTLPALAEALSRLLSDRALVGNWSAANLVILAGESIFALRCFRRDPDYYTLFLRTEPEAVTVSSEPLDDAAGWLPLGDRELVELSLPLPRRLFLQGIP